MDAEKNLLILILFFSMDFRWPNANSFFLFNKLNLLKTEHEESGVEVNTEAIINLAKFFVCYCMNKRSMNCLQQEVNNDFGGFFEHFIYYFVLKVFCWLVWGFIECRS